MSRVQVVRPAGAGHETLYVLLVSLFILAMAAGVVALRGENHDEVSIEAHQLDARRDLNAAEQGVYADLRVAFEEIQLLREDQPALVEVAVLAEEGFPPFVTDASSASRGEHQWQVLGDQAYLGLSQSPSVAGSFLLLVPSAHDGAADIWLQRKAGASAPGDFTPAALIAAGWQQIAAHYDAGVTRQHRH
ncbi:hypothetical protein D3C77_06490 [compost metagenome]|uniref:DUF6162 family protein n=1 Tax=Pseudomonas TaxID=286 RepID=UPI00040C4666|nr:MULTISPECIES: DUF6162 family protein [Pseudomonas]MCW2270819.1 hypothetical protein [Pseudomonas sp. JUb96]PRA65963.1 hypothetical protein CQ065_11675 [Pseudomonas sp. MYb187]